MTDALLLDYNGVIVDDERLHCATFRGVLHDEGIAVPEADYNAHYLGLDDRAAFLEAFRRAGRLPGIAETKRLVERKAAAYAALASLELPVVPGVAEFVFAAARSAKIAVVSGAIRSEIVAGLEHAGLTGLVQVIVSAEDVPASKPDPAGFALGLRRLRALHGGAKWRAVAIEDSLRGLQAARGVGAGCVMLTTSFKPSELLAADRVWFDFLDHTPAELDPVWREVRA